MPGPGFSFRNGKFFFIDVTRGIGYCLFPFFILNSIIRLEGLEILCKPGDGIQFGAVSLDEAGLALQEMEDRINDFIRKIN